MPFVSSVTTPINKMRVRDIYKCMVCMQRHSLRYCQKFVMMDVSERRTVVRDNDYCLNCLARSHTVDACQSDDRCKKCGYQHHTMLHPRNVYLPYPKPSILDRLEAVRVRKTQQRLKPNPSTRPRQQLRSTQRQTVIGRPRRVARTGRMKAQKIKKVHQRAQPNQLILSQAIKSLATVLCASSYIAKAQGRRHGQI
ncbi:uncharacterized protein LOC142241996 [Haematobia irritans]|uniref:uncharacterized protein LOC142241996 n=1 Tax=Haematobia irritans TaxID=7368 RepID=UPI003F509653